MINTPNHGEGQFSWQDILWRLLVTVLILILLTGFSLSLFNNIAVQPERGQPPALMYDVPVN